MKQHSNHMSLKPMPRNQRGVVLLFSLIALAIMLIVAVALVRSFNTSLFTSGNIAFKRDLQNQSERAVAAVLTQFRSGGNLSSKTQRAANNATYNYSATMLPVDAQGIPLALQNNTSFASVGTGSDLLSTDNSVKVRYVIDRLCASVGDESTLGGGSCRLADNPVPPGKALSELQSADSAPLCSGCSSAAPQGVVYRLSIRVTGPRNTQSFFQSTFTVPS